MHALNEIFATIDGYIGGSTWFVYLLVGTGLFFTLYLGFPQIRYFRHAFLMVTGKYDEKGAKGDTTHFRALTTALSGTVGTGNIAGVALAIHLGGPAALFWMLVTAMVGMTTKFVEVTLSHKYREFTEDGTAASTAACSPTRPARAARRSRTPRPRPITRCPRAWWRSWSPSSTPSSSAP